MIIDDSQNNQNYPKIVSVLTKLCYYQIGVVS